jgi:hypothetical protein
LSAKCESGGFNPKEHKIIPILPDELDAEYRSIIGLGSRQIKG